MHAGITAITGLAVKNGLAKSVAFGQRNQNSKRLIIFMTDVPGNYARPIAVWRTKERQFHRVKYWEILADNLSKAGCVSAAVDSRGRTIWIADAHRGDGRRFVVRADEKLTAFMELASAIRVAK